MSFRISFLATELPVQNVSKILGVRLGAQPNSMADGNFIARLKKAPRTIAFYDDVLILPLLRRKARILSKKSDVVLFSVCETMMNFYSECFSKGKPLWRVTYSGMNGPSTLNSFGMLPETYKTIVDKYTKEQETAHDYDAISQVTTTLVADFAQFRYDDWLEIDEFETIETFKRKNPLPTLFKL